MHKVTMNPLIGALLATTVAAAPVPVLAHDSAGMRGSYGPACDMMGPGMGMMGGYDSGNGMMGPGMGMMGGMMGSGMGMGSGMMGGYGMGMSGAGPLAILDLSDEQRTKIDQILAAQRKQHRTIMIQMFDEQDKLRELYSAETPDPKKVGAVYGAISKLQQQMIESHVQANNDMQAVLTKEQREQLRKWRWGGSAGGGMMRP